VLPAFRGKDLEHLTFVIDSTPEVVRVAIDPHEHLVQVPTPVRIRIMMNSTFPDLGFKHRAEPVPPESDRLVADVDAAFEE